MPSFDFKKPKEWNENQWRTLIVLLREHYPLTCGQDDNGNYEMIVRVENGFILNDIKSVTRRE